MKKALILLALIAGVALAWAAPPDRLPNLLTPPAEARTVVVVGGGVPATAGYATPAIDGTPAYGMASSGSSIDTSAIATTTGNTIIALVFIYGDTNTRQVSSIADTASNTYTLCGTRYQPATGVSMEAWIAHNITGNASNVPVATFSGALDAVGIAYMYQIEVTNLHASAAFDKLAGATVAETTALATGTTATTAQTHEYILGFFVANASITCTPGTNYTERSDDSGVYLEDRSVTSAGAYQATATASSSCDAYGLIATFKAKAL